MKNKILLFIGCFSSVTVFSQIPEDVLKYSWINPNGTARNQAIGGAMGSLGGDISSILVNPAGLGFYKTSEFVITPGFSFLKNKSNFRETVTSDNKSAFNLGTTGFVSGFSDKYSKFQTKAFAIAVTQTANFNSHIAYKGQNNFSSFSEQYAAEIAASNLSLDDVLNSDRVSYASRMAVYAFLADTLTRPGNSFPDVVGQPMRYALKNNKTFLLNQDNFIDTKGGITEIDFGFASNKDDKLYIGGSLGVPIVNYNRKVTYNESDATNDTSNYFGSAHLSEEYTTKGVGFNAKLGLIFKPAEQIRIGLAIHSPTFYGLKDTYDATLTVDPENYRPYADKPNYKPGVTTVNAATFTGGQIAQYKYDLASPWRVLVSGSYVLQEVEDVKRQKGFITADIEYVNYKSNRFSSQEDDNGNASNSGNNYDGVNQAIKDYYKGAFNFRVGGELKFTTIMARLGFAYYGNPYKEKEDLKARKMFVSGGLGYRNKGIFIDLTYVLGLNKDVNFPYRLPDKANTFASINQTAGKLGLTVGFKL